jgi:hypothetical protein
VGGFGRDDEFPSLYRLSVQNNDVQEQFAPGSSGVAWNGQSDAVERFIRGFDSNLRSEIEEELKKHSDSVKQYVVDTVNKILDTLSQRLPDGTTIEMPESADISIDWQRYSVGIDFANLAPAGSSQLRFFLGQFASRKGPLCSRGCHSRRQNTYWRCNKGRIQATE